MVFSSTATSASFTPGALGSSVIGTFLDEYILSLVA